MRYFIFIMFLLINSCKSNDAIEPDANYTAGLAQKGAIYSTWKLTTYESNQKIAYDVILEFKTEKNEKGNNILSGKSSVNFYQADFTIINSKIVISNLSMTEIAGNANASSFEKDYLKRLNDTSNFSIDGETLTLSSTNQKMIFKRNN